MLTLGAHFLEILGGLFGLTNSKAAKQKKVFRKEIAFFMPKDVGFMHYVGHYVNFFFFKFMNKQRF